MVSIKFCIVHDSEKSYSEKHKKYECKACKNEYAKQYREKNLEVIKEKARLYNIKTRERRQAWVKQDRIDYPDRYKKYAKNVSPEQVEARNIKRNINKYGLTVAQYMQMLVRCNNKCEICGNEEIRKTGKGDKLTRLSVDHCHKSGKVRGLLCHKCNTSIGRLHDDIAILKSMIRYLESHKHLE